MARMPRKTKRKIGLIAALLILLSLLTLLYVNYLATKKIGFDVAVDSGSAVTPPQFLYSFAGAPPNQLQRPLGVFADGTGYVWVTDSIQGRLLKYREDGTFVGSYGKGTLLTPLYIVKNPLNGRIYVSDRRTRQIHIFDAGGKYLGIFDPKLPKNQRPTFTTVQWAPVAMAFAPDGTFYVTELLKGHRLLIFGPDGKFKKSVGDAGIPKDPNSGPELFQFPNSIKVHGNEVWVADSNNRRIQVFSRDGEFKRMLVTSGLPRGFDFLPQLAGRKKDAPALLTVIDTLAHDATIWDATGNKMLTFGGQGVMDGQFSYPNDLSVGTKAKIFVADTYNARIQVWGWPSETAVVKLPPLPQYWGWCLTPLLLLPLLLLPPLLLLTLLHLPLLLLTRSNSASLWLKAGS